MHPCLSGAPFCHKYFERVLATLHREPGVVFWAGEQILNRYTAGGGKRRRH